MARGQRTATEYAHPVFRRWIMRARDVNQGRQAFTLDARARSRVARPLSAAFPHDILQEPDLAHTRVAAAHTRAIFAAYVHADTRCSVGPRALFGLGVAKMPTGVNRSAVPGSACLRDKEAKRWRQRE